MDEVNVFDLVMGYSLCYRGSNILRTSEYTRPDGV